MRTRWHGGCPMPRHSGEARFQKESSPLARHDHARAGVRAGRHTTRSVLRRNFGGDSGKESSEAFDSSQYNFGASIPSWVAASSASKAIQLQSGLLRQDRHWRQQRVPATGTWCSGFRSGGSRASASSVRPRRRGPAQLEVGLRYRRRRDRREQPDVERRRRRPPFFGSSAGIRFDVRYFRTIDDLEIRDIPIAAVAREGRFHERLAGLRIQVLTSLTRICSPRPMAGSTDSTPAPHPRRLADPGLVRIGEGDDVAGF